MQRGTYANTATVSSVTPDGNTSDNTWTVTPVPTPLANVSVLKTVDNSAPVVGSNVVFTIRAANAGPSDAVNVTATDVLPTGYSFVSATPSVGTYDQNTGIWTIGNLANGADATLNIVAIVNATGTYANTATVSTVTPDGNTADNTSTVTPVPTPLANVSVVKTVDNTAPVVGSNVVFTIRAANAGPSEATGVVATDLLPTGYTFVSAAPSAGTYDQGTGIWTIGNLANGADATLNIVAIVNATGTYANTATVSSVTPDGNTADNTSTVTPVPSPLSNVSVVKTVDNAAPVVGSNVVFTIRAANAGPSEASNVTATDLLPTGYTFVSATPSVGTYDSTTGIWTIGNLANGADATLNIVAIVNATGTYANTATVSTVTPDGNTADNTSTVTPVPTPLANVSVVKTVDNTAPAVGSNVVFTIRAANAGPSEAANVTATDVLPTGYTFVSATPSVGTYDQNTGIWTIGNLANGADATLNIVSIVNATGTYANTATVSSVTPDGNTADNTSTVTPVPSPLSNVSVVKTVDNAAPVVGSNVVFTIRAANAGPSEAANVTATDVLPAGYSFVSATPSVGTYDQGTGIWTIGNLANGADATLNIVAIVNATGTYANTATVSSVTPDGNTADNTSTVTPKPNNPPVATATPIVTPQDTPVNGTVTASDPDGDPVTYTVSTPPVHGTVVINPDGTYTYTPTAGYNGPDSFVTTVCDDKGACTTATVDITVTPKPNNPPVATATPIVTPQDTPVNGTVTASDPDGDPLTYTVSTAPEHGTVVINPDGSYTYTPTAGYNGPDSFVTTVCDDKGACTTATVDITVTPKPNNPPVATATPVVTPQDTPVNGTVTASDPDGDPVTYTVSTSPVHGTVVINPDGTYTYTPTAGYSGPDSFVTTVCDDKGACTTATVDITVTPKPNNPPVATATPVVTPQDTPVNGTVTASDPDGDPVTYTVTTPPVHGTVVINPDGTYTYTPTAGYNGPDSFVTTVCDDKGACTTATVDITVTPKPNNPPVATATPIVTPQDTPIDGKITASDPDGDPVTYTVSTAPVHGTVVINPDGTYTYTPATGYSGPDSFVTTVCDDKGACTTATVDITVTPKPNNPPVATATPIVTPQDTPVNGTVTASDPDGDPVTYTVSTPPVHGTVVINPDGSYTYTPTAGYSGQDSFVVTVCDDKGACTTATVDITVTPKPNNPPVATATPVVTPQDTPVNGTVTASDPDGDPVTYTVSTAPEHGTVVINPDGSYTYTPTAGYSGPDSFVTTVCDDKGACTTATVDITVTPKPNNPPVATATPIVTPQDTPVNGTVTASDPDGDPVTYVVSTAPEHGTVVINPDGSYTYTPATGYNGPDSFVTTVCDDKGACTTATVDITVTPKPNNPPVATATPIVTPQDTPVNGTVTASDPDGDPVTYTVTTPPVHGTVVINPDGTYTYTPTAGYNGPDSFVTTVCDDKGACTTATVDITVTPKPNNPPVATATPIVTPQDTPVNGTVTASDPDGDPVTYTVTTAPVHGTVVINPDGSYTYTPTAGYNGPDSFVTTVCDDKGACTTATVDITVTPKPNNPPVATATPVVTPQDTPVNGTVTASDPDGDPVTYTVTTPPVHGTVVINPDGTYTYTPTAGYNGPDSFVTTVCDDKGACTTATVDITVTPKPNNPPVATATPVVTPQDTPVNGTVTASDPDGDPVTYTVSTAPVHGTVVINPDGTYTYTPTAGYNGPDSFVTTVCDDKGACTTATVDITVTPKPNNPPVATATPVVTPQDTPVNGTVTASDPDGDPVTYTVSTPPVHGTVVINPDGTYTYTPTAGYNGPDSFVVTVCDDKGACTTATVDITVTPKPNNPPVATATPVVTPQDTPVNGTVTASDPDGDPVTYTVSTPPVHGTVVINPDGTYTYTPTAGYNGPDSFVVTVCDDKGACTTATVDITVTPKPNNPPVATATPVVTPQDTPVNGTVTASDPDGDPVTYTVSTPPVHGTVVINPDGSYTYTPTVGYNGPDSFVTTVCDDKGACTTATVDITVTPKPNNPPVATATPIVTPQDTPVNGTVTASDPDGDPVTYTVTTAPVHGTVVINPDGSYTYTPTAGYNGPDSFVVTVCDDKGACTTATVQITITPKPNNPPAAPPILIVTPQDTPVNGKITANDPDGDPLTYTVSTAPEHGTVVINPDGTYTYTPATGYNGPDSFVVTVCDDKGACTTATVDITVTPAPVVGSNVSVVKTVDNATPVAGSNVVFTIRASNAGPGDAANVIARDILPSGYTFISANAPATTTYNSTTGIWTIGNLVSGSNISLAITARVNATGIYTNTATIATTSPDGNIADNTSTVTPVPTPLSDVSVVKTVNNATPVVGSNVVFTIRIANTGPSDATGVIATDLLPSGYTFVSANAPASTTYNSTTGNWTIGNLVSGSNASLTITARVNASGTYANTATITSTTPDGNMANNTATVTPVPTQTKPVAFDDAVTTDFNTPVRINILNDDKPDGSPLQPGSVDIITKPLHGTVVVNADGSVTYTPSPGFTGTDIFTYRVTDANGNWTNVASATITIEGFFIPNVFTPNGDGKNDTFFIVGADSFDSVDIEIYNRWGNQVYRTKGYKNDWTGTGLNEGTYFYKVTLKKGADTKTVAGPVLLKRQ
jgi:gliding motility-associated-like protein/uncharacterized repeat protein (TIGR01451 family)